MSGTPSRKASHAANPVGPGAPQDGTCGMCLTPVVLTRGNGLLCPRCDGTTGAPPEPPMRT